MSPDKKTDAIAVIGIGCLFPQAKTLRQYWANIKNKVDTITDVPASHWKAQDYFDADPKKPDHVYAYKGGFLDTYDFDPSEFGLAPNNLEATDPAQLFGLVAAKMALTDAGYAPDKDWDKSRVSVILGVTGTLELVVPLGARLGHPHWRRALAEAGVSKEIADDVVARIADSYVPWQENSFPGLLGNVVAGRIANRFNLGGTNCVVDAACGSSLSAAHMACLELQTGRANMVLTGGIDMFNDIFMYMCFTKTPALSAGGHARPFDAKADGTTLGEGVGMVVLKRLDDARRDGDRIYAVIRGIGSSSDGRGKSIYAPSADGQTRALREAYRVSGVSPETIGLVEAHGTGTTVGDGIELSALSSVYRDANPEGTWAALGSVKSQIGHTKAAAGSAALIKAVMALHHKVIPPTIKVSEPLPALASGQSPLYISLEKRPWLAPLAHPRRAACSALGFGGTNFHAVLEENAPQKTNIDWDGQVEIIAISGRTDAELSAALQSFGELTSWDQLRLVAADSRSNFKPDAGVRLVIVLEREMDWKAHIAKAVTVLAENKGRTRWPAVDGIYFGSGNPGKLGVIFPGQGSQYVGMGRDLMCQFPDAFNVLERADKAFTHSRRLSDFIFPRPDWRAQEKQRQELELRKTDVAQPALGAVATGLWQVLQSFGVNPDGFAGHSYGELVALHASGRLTEESLHFLSGLRGRLMASSSQDLGGMLAVLASLSEVEEAVKSENLDVVIANRNAPEQNVLSGATSIIDRAEKLLSARGLRVSRLPVAAAFHSPLVAQALAPLSQALEKIDFTKAEVPVYANTTGEAYPSSEKESRQLLANQLARPVEFVKLITAMHRDGVRTFIEVGAGNKMSGLVAQTLKGQVFSAISLDSSSGRKSGSADLARVLAQLAALGHGINLGLWQDGRNGLYDARPKPKMSVPLTGAPYRSTPPQARPARTISPVAVPSTVSPDMAQQALLAAQSSIEALGQMQQQASALHLQYLQGQETAQKTIQQLIEQQQALAARLNGTVGQAPITVMPKLELPFAPIVQAAVPARSPAAAPDDLTEILRLVIAEKTGYPSETIHADMDLEGDLGIDSIKRVEILSAVAEKLPHAPKIKPEHLGTMRTLKAIADYLGQGNSASVLSASPKPVVSLDISGVIVGIVAEKTGYPQETILPEMDLEGDLGIDSIKRVEILSAVAEKLPQAPKIKPEHLGTMRTLKAIVAYLSQGEAQAQPAPATKVTVPNNNTLEVLAKVVADKTGYPAETINPDMDLEGDLGIDSIKRVEILSSVADILPNAPKVKPEHLGTLRTLRALSDYLGAEAKVVVAAPQVEVQAPYLESMGLQRQVLELVPVGPRDLSGLDLTRTIAITRDSGLDAALAREMSAHGFKTQIVAIDSPDQLPADIGGLILVAPASPAGEKCPWNADSEAWLTKAFEMTQAAARLMGTRGLIASVTRMDGALGLSGSEFDPAFGGIAGLIKTAAREWEHMVCRAIDIDPMISLDAAARLLAKEIAFSAPVETAISEAGVRTLELEERQINASQAVILNPSDVVIVTGGARGVTAQAAIAIAQQYKPTMVLIGRSPLPDQKSDVFASAVSKTDLRREIAQKNKRLSPKDIAAQADAILAEREIRHTLKKIEDMGVKAIYRAVDIRDQSAVALFVAQTQKELGVIRGLVHGAGVLADKLIAQKTHAQWESVLSTKLTGLRNLLSELPSSQLQVLALFSSSTARFGRTGQSDYAVANEVLNKTAQLLSRRWPQCRVVAIGWGPWDGGMVDASLKKQFAEEGVGVIGLSEGGNHLVRELTAQDGAAETVVIAGVATPSKSVWTIASTRTISIETHPFLSSHVINARAVVPLAISAEWMAHAVLHDQPGLSFIGFDDLRVHKPIVVPTQGSVTISIGTQPLVKRQGLLTVATSLQDQSGSVLVSAVVLLAARRLSPPSEKPEDLKGKPYGSTNQIYEKILFHGPQMRFITSVPICDESGILAEIAATRPPASWMQSPLRDQWIADPTALDAAFQAMILWTTQRKGAPSLPSFVSQYRQYRDFPSQGLRVAARIQSQGEAVIRADIDFIDRVGDLVAHLKGYECTVSPALAESFRRNDVRVPA